MLKRRFLLAFLPLPLLMLGVGLYAVHVLYNLERCIKDLGGRNLERVIAADRMQEAALQMDQSMVRLLQETDPVTLERFKQGASTFEQSLSVALRDASDPSESRVTQQLEQAFQSMQAIGHTLSSVPQSQRAQIRPAFDQLKAKVHMLTKQLRSMSSDGIQSNVAEADNIRRSSTVVLSCMMLVATLLWLLVSVRLAQSILHPVRALIGSIKARGENQTSPEVTRTAPDEMGLLVREFNKMSTRLDAYRNSTAARVVRAQRILHATLAAMPDPVYVVDGDLRVELKNAAAERVYGDCGEELPVPLKERAAQVLSEGRDYLPRLFQESLLQQVENERRYFLPKIFIMRDEENSLLGAAIVLEDVTQFRLLDDLKSNFVSTVSHEIKTPLTSIRMAVHLLEEGSVGELQPRQAELLKTAKEDISRLLRLLNNLLDLAHFEHGNPRMHWEEVCVCHLVEESVEEVKTLVNGRGLTLKVDCKNGLPPLYIDRARISHVLRNLLTNAIKHSPEGDVILFSVSEAENGGVQFTVKDKGAGIPKKYHERIFERFFRVPGEKTHGSGLGLSIAREIILAHTGTIGCESEPDQETRFFFSLPTSTEQRERLRPLSDSHA